MALAGYRKETISQVAQKLVRKLLFGKKGPEEPDPDEEEKTKIAVINYNHGIGHRLLKAAKLFNIKVVFKFPHKLGTLPSSVNGEVRSCQKAQSTHTQFRTCKREVVYSIPLSCGRSYVGQTQKCINERLTEHKRSKGSLKTEYMNMQNHIEDCGCRPDFPNTGILGVSGRSRLARELSEAFWIMHMGEMNVSIASIKITDVEYRLMKSAFVSKKSTD